jgi:putative RNA 2'-phosphotransferase
MSKALPTNSQASPSSTAPANQEVLPRLLQIVRAWQSLPPHVQESMACLAELGKKPHNMQQLEAAADFSETVKQRIRNLHSIHFNLLKVLRHRPNELNLKMNADGWVNLEYVIQWIESLLPEVRHIGVTNVLAELGDRIQIQDGKIRATYGHSCSRFRPSKPSVPNLPLFHGTSSDRWPNIELFGLRPGDRRYVQLTSSFEYAVQIAMKHPQEAIVIQVSTIPAIDEGVKFYATGTHAWLAEAIPSSCLQVWNASTPITEDSGIDFDCDSKLVQPQDCYPYMEAL